MEQRELLSLYGSTVLGVLIQDLKEGYTAFWEALYQLISFVPTLVS